MVPLFWPISSLIWYKQEYMKMIWYLHKMPWWGSELYDNCASQDMAALIKGGHSGPIMCKTLIFSSNIIRLQLYFTQSSWNYWYHWSNMAKSMIQVQLPYMAWLISIYGNNTKSGKCREKYFTWHCSLV